MKFEKPEMEIIEFDANDIIVTSDCQGTVEDPSIPDGDIYSAGTYDNCQPGQVG